MSSRRPARCCQPIPRWRAALGLVLAVTIFLGLARIDRVAAQPPELSIQASPPANFQLLWNNAGGPYELQSTTSLRPPVSWQTDGRVPAVVGQNASVLISASERTRFFRLRGAGLTRVTGTSPADGESGVSVSRETVVRFNNPLSPSTILSTEHLYAEFAGRRLLSRVQLSNDRKAATLFYLENLPGNARIRVTLDGDSMEDVHGRLIDPDDNGTPGGVAFFEFETCSTTPVPRTAVIGRVFASELVTGPDGQSSSLNRPLRNVTITVDGMEETLRTVTDAQGNFKLMPVPAGRFFVHVDGRTAEGSLWPTGEYYPFVGKAWEAIAGREDNLAGGTGEIYLPLIHAGTLQPVSFVEPATITFPPEVLANNPGLEGVFITVPPNALYSDSGARGGRVGIAAVPPDRLPEPLPDDLRFPVVITVQTDGPSNFAEPVPVTFPNLPDPVTGQKLPPGAKSALWSFDHDLGEWRIAGPMTVSADGNFVVSDPGVGILQPGWHGSQPGSQGEGGEIEGQCEEAPVQLLRAGALSASKLAFSLHGPAPCTFGPIIHSALNSSGGVTFTASPDHDEGTVVWSAPTAAAGMQSGTGNSFQTAFCTPGTHVVRAVLNRVCGEPCGPIDTVVTVPSDFEVKCDSGSVNFIGQAQAFRAGDPIRLRWQASDPVNSAGSGAIFWEAEGGEPASGTGFNFTTRYCLAEGQESAVKKIKWQVTASPCIADFFPEGCGGELEVTVVRAQCDLDEIVAGSLAPKVGDAVIFSTRAHSAGTISWIVPDGALQSYTGPDLPHSGTSDYTSSAVALFCSPGRKRITAQLTTPCGQVCERAIEVNVEGSECQSQPLTIAEGSPMTDTVLFISTIVDIDSTVLWEAPGAEILEETKFAGLRAVRLRYCQPGPATVTARVTTRCGVNCEETLLLQIQPLLSHPLTEIRTLTPVRSVNPPVDAYVGDSVEFEITSEAGGTLQWVAEHRISHEDGEHILHPQLVATTLTSRGQTQAYLGTNPPTFDSPVRATAIFTFVGLGLHHITVRLETACGRSFGSVNSDFYVTQRPLFAAEAQTSPVLLNLPAGEIPEDVSAAWGVEPAAEEAAMLEELQRRAPSRKLAAPAVDDPNAPPGFRQKGLHYFFIQNLETGRIRRGIAGNNGFAHSRPILLAPQSRHREYILQASTFQVGMVEYTTPDNGQAFTIPKIVLRPAEGLDSDGDGLPDIAELIVGTDPGNRDTNGDGITDAAEVREGTVLLGGPGMFSGVIASVRTPGPAYDISVSGNLVAVSCPPFVSLFNVFRGQDPVEVARLTTEGGGLRVASIANFVAVADGAAGLAIIDTLSPSTWQGGAAARPTRQVRRLGRVECVAAAGRIAAAGNSAGELALIALDDGSVLQSLALDNLPIADVMFSGDFLYAISTAKLHIISIGKGALSPLGSIDLVTPGAARRLFAAEGLAHVVHPTQFDTYDVSIPTSPVLLRQSFPLGTGWRHVVLNDSGLALGAVGLSDTTVGQGLTLFDVSNPVEQPAFLENVPFPGIVHAISIHNGRAYAAAGDAGLQVVNYLALDTRRQPPAIALSASFPLEPAVVEEGKMARVTAHVADDVQVRNVDFYIDGRLVEADGNYPFEYRFATPARRTQSSFTLRAVATDTGGNEAETEITVGLTADVFAPALAGTSPSDGATLATIGALTAFFDEPISGASLTSDGFRLVEAGPDGRFGTPDDLVIPGAVVEHRPDILATLFRLSANLPPGVYRAELAAGIRDLAGNATTAAQTWTFTLTGPPKLGAQRLATGRRHTLAIELDGGLWAWGQNAFGQVGDGTREDQARPVRIGTATDWLAVAASEDHSAAIKHDGSLWTWGDRGPQLGQGNINTPVLFPVQVGTDKDWVFVAAGEDQFFAIKNDGTLWGWGRNESGQLGNGSNGDANRPLPIGLDSDWLAVSASTDESMSLGLKKDGTVWAWGAPSRLGSDLPVQLGSDADWLAISAYDDAFVDNGLGPAAIKTDGTLWTLVRGSGANPAPSWTQYGAEQDWKALMAGNSHLLALKTDGSLWVIGYNGQGQLGDGSLPETYSEGFVRVGPGALGEVAAFATGWYHNVAVTTDGLYYTWGENSNRQLGTGFVGTPQAVPLQVGTDADWETIVLTQRAAFALKRNGTLWAWGMNESGVLGDGTTIGRVAPGRVGSDSDWALVSASDGVVLAIKRNGTLWGWGSRLLLGFEDFNRQLTPIQIGTDSDWVMAAAAGSHCQAIKRDGSVWGWGLNHWGQPGFGELITQPTRIGQDNDWKTVVATDFRQTFALKNDGTIWGWGDNSFDALGIGSRANPQPPVRIGEEDGWIAIAPDAFFIRLAIKSDGSLWRWQGAAGATVFTSADRFRFEGLPPWRSVSVSFTHWLGLRADGSLWAEGSNHQGQLGDGIQTESAIPLFRVDSANDWKEVAAFGSGISAAIKDNGTLWTWGDASAGSLGHPSLMMPRLIGNSTSWAAPGPQP